MSMTQASPLPEVRAKRVLLRRDLCPIVECVCGAHVMLTYHDPRGACRSMHELCPSCGSDVYLDLFHYFTAYGDRVRKYVESGDEHLSAAFARRAVTLYRKNRKILQAVAAFRAV